MESSNKIGPSIDPCGTPEIIFYSSYKYYLTLRIIKLSLKFSVPVTYAANLVIAMS